MDVTVSLRPVIGMLWLLAVAGVVASATVVERWAADIGTFCALLACTFTVLDYVERRRIAMDTAINLCRSLPRDLHSINGRGEHV